MCCTVTINASRELMWLCSIPDIQTRDPAWYQALTQALDEEQGKQLHDIGTLADQRRAAHGESQS